MHFPQTEHNCNKVIISKYYKNNFNIFNKKTNNSADKTNFGHNSFFQKKIFRYRKFLLFRMINRLFAEPPSAQGNTKKTYPAKRCTPQQAQTTIPPRIQIAYIKDTRLIAFSAAPVPTKPRHEFINKKRFIYEYIRTFIKKMAERQGFEPWIQVLARILT